MSSETAARFSVSLPQQLLADLDSMVQAKSYDNRSLAIADMIRRDLVEHRAKLPKGESTATVTLVFDHHQHHVQAALTDLQHDATCEVVATMHVHLDHHQCLEVIVVRGKARAIQQMADQLIAVKGVEFGRLTFATAV